MGRKSETALLGCTAIAVVSGVMLGLRTGFVYLAWWTLAYSGLPVGEPGLVPSLAIAFAIGLLASAFGSGKSK